jgi:hypothetical protein
MCLSEVGDGSCCCHEGSDSAPTEALKSSTSTKKNISFPPPSFPKGRFPSLAPVEQSRMSGVVKPHAPARLATKAIHFHSVFSVSRRERPRPLDPLVRRLLTLALRIYSAEWRYNA